MKWVSATLCGFGFTDIFLKSVLKCWFDFHLFHTWGRGESFNLLTIILLLSYNLSAPGYITLSPYLVGFGPIKAQVQCANSLHACYICPGIAPRTRRNSLSNWLFLLSMSQLRPSPGLQAQLLQRVITWYSNQKLSDIWEMFFVMCI